MIERKKIMGKDFKRYATLIPDDVEVWVGIGKYQSRLVDILKDVKNNRVILVNHTYLDYCTEVESKE